MSHRHALSLVLLPQAPAQAAEVVGKKSGGTALKDRFQRLVGADAFISEGKLKPIKTVGSGSFATGIRTAADRTRMKPYFVSAKKQAGYNNAAAA